MKIMKQSKTNCDLKSCMFCRLCMKEWLPAIDVNRRTMRVKKGEVIFAEGEKVTGMYFVFNGTIKVHKKWGDKELIVRFAMSGDIAGHRGLGNEMIYPVSATAIEDSLVCFIDIAFFTASLKVNPGFLYELLLFFADELKVSERKMRNMAHMPVKGRLANALLMLQNKFGVTESGSLNITLTRQDLASYAGTTYETVFRVLADFVENGWIMLSEKDITILQEQQLLDLSNEGNN